MLRPTTLPWARPRYELLLLALVAVAALTIVQPQSPQDWTRMCLTGALAHARLTVDGCIDDSIDRSRYGGHFYSDKAPGMSLLSLPGYEALRLPPPSRWSSIDRRLWLVRLTVCGVAFLLCAFLVGRVAEGLAPRWGGPTLVTFALGTLALPFAATGFDHVPAMVLGFAAFLFLWSRRPLVAGLAAGLAVLVEYELAAVALVLVAYAALLGRHAVARFALGAVPGVAALAAYNWRAFGAPWHNSLSYSANAYTEAHQHGILGIRAPTLHATRLVFSGEKGLLVTSPVLAAAAFGLWLLWRRGARAEAAVCAAVTVAFLVGECGYFDPYGGTAPGPRYFIPALPFLALGLAPSFARLPWVTGGLAALSVVASTTAALTWSTENRYRQTVWGELARVPGHWLDSKLVLSLTKNALVFHGANDRIYGALIVGACAAAALVVSVAAARR